MSGFFPFLTRYDLAEDVEGLEDFFDVEVMVVLRHIREDDIIAFFQIFLKLYERILSMDSYKLFLKNQLHCIYVRTIGSERIMYK
tara:strand:- start:78 stop:332 length:255 start_codon:yes stop_codon:yes gene_type:complete